MSNLLPENYKIIENSKLYFITSDGNEIYLCNFVPQVISAIKVTLHNSPADSIEINLRLLVDECSVDIEKNLTLSELRTADWESMDYRCGYSTEISISQIKRHLYAVIQFQLKNEDMIIHELPKYNHMGWVTYKGQYAYLAGDKLITADGIVSEKNYVSESILNEYKLEINNNLDERKASLYILHLMKVELGITDVLVANLIVSLLRPLFKESGIIPSYTCYLVGKSQTRKTTIARHSSIIYNRSTNNSSCMINLLSTTAAVHKSLGFLNDACFIVDDLYRSERPQDMHAREERASEFIRTLGNNSAKVVASQSGNITNKSPNCNIIFTAEYLLQGISTLSRCLILFVDKPIPSEPLYKSQQDPLALSTFAYYFLKWCCQYYDVIVELIKNEWQAYQNNRAKNFRARERLYETRFILYTAVEILGKYFVTTGNMGDEIKVLMINNIKISLNNLIHRQQIEIQKISGASDENKFSKFLAVLYFDNHLELEKSKSDISKKSQGIVNKEILCISPSFYLGKCIEHFKNSDITINKITAELQRNGLVDMDASGKSTKKIHGIRLLHIPIFKLQSYYEDAKNDEAFLPRKSVFATADLNDKDIDFGNQNRIRFIDEDKIPSLLRVENQLSRKKLQKKIRRYNG